MLRWNSTSLSNPLNPFDDTAITEFDAVQESFGKWFLGECARKSKAEGEEKDPDPAGNKEQTHETKKLREKKLKALTPQFENDEHGVPIFTVDTASDWYQTVKGRQSLIRAYCTRQLSMSHLKRLWALLTV